MQLNGKKIGFALTGSFCTFGTIFPEIEKLIATGADVFPIVSENVKKYDTRFGRAEEWITKFEVMTGKKVISTIVEAEPIGPKSLLDIIIVAPCTGNTLAKIAGAVTDSSVTMAVKAHLRNGKPVVLSVSTNDGLSNNAKNLGTVLNMKNVFLVPFGQDDPVKKPNSLVAHCELITQTLSEALEGRQLQPLLM